MRAVVNSDWYNEAVKIIANLIGPDVDCMLSVKGSKVSIEASNAEAWIKVPLQVEEIEGEGRLFTKVEYLSALKAKGSITLVYEEGSDHISVDMGRSRGAIRVINASDAEIDRPENTIKIAAVMPAQSLLFATGATAFKPLLSASAPNAIIEVDNKTLTLTSYDTYIGTHYKTHNEEIKSKGAFNLIVEMDYWRRIVAHMNGDMTVKTGANDRSFRVKTDRFDLYHAVIDADTQDVGQVIETLKEQESLAIIELDGKDVIEAIESVKGIIRSGGKEGARFTITLNKDMAVLAAESTAGEMEAEFDIDGYEGDEDISFTVSSDSFSDTLKLTRDESVKYAPVRLTVLREYLIMESLKVPVSSIAPVLQD